MLAIAGWMTAMLIMAAAGFSVSQIYETFFREPERFGLEKELARGTLREQIKTREAVTLGQKRAFEYMTGKEEKDYERLLKAQREQRAFAGEERYQARGEARSERQMAMLMSLIQSMGQAGPQNIPMPRPASPMSVARLVRG